MCLDYRIELLRLNSYFREIDEVFEGCFWLHVGCWFCRWLWSPGFQSTAERVGGFTAEIRGGRDRLRKKKRPNDLPRLFCTFLWLLFHLWLKRSHRLSLTDCRRGPAAKKKKKSTLCFFRADKWLWEAVRVLSDGFQIFSVTSVTSAPCWVEVFAQLFKPGVGLWNLYPEGPFLTVCLNMWSFLSLLTEL